MEQDKVKFGRNVLIAGGTTTLKSLRNLLLLPVLTHGLDGDQYGLWESILPAIALICPFVSLQLSGAIVRNLSGISDPRELREGFYSILFAAMGISLLSTAMITVVVQFADVGSVTTSFRPFLAILLFAIPTTIGNGIALEFLRSMRLFAQHSAALLVQLFGELLLFQMLLQGDAGIGELLLALIGARVVSLALALSVTVRRIGFSIPRFSHLRDYLALTIPLVPNATVYRLFDAADRFILLHYRTAFELGLYAAAYNAGSLFSTLLSPIQFVLYPQLANMWNTDRITDLANYISQALRFAGTLLIPAVAGAFLLARPVFDLLVSEKYLEATNYFPILGLSFSAFSIGVLLSHILIIGGHTKTVLAIDSGMTVLNVLLNLMLVPSYGISAAVYSTLACHLTYSLAIGVCSRRLIRFAIPWAHFLRSTIATICMLGSLGLIQAWVTLPLISAILTGAAVYAGTMTLLGGITSQDIRLLKQIIGRSA